MGKEKENKVMEKVEKEVNDFLVVYANMKDVEIKKVWSKLETNEETVTFWSKFKKYDLYKHLEYKSFKAYILKEFKVNEYVTNNGDELKKLPRYAKMKNDDVIEDLITVIRNQIDNIVRFGTKKGKKAVRKSSTPLEKAKKACDGLEIEDLILLQVYIEKLISENEDTEKEEKEEKKVKKVA